MPRHSLCCLAAVASAASVTAECIYRWVQATPLTRFDFGIAYDSTRQRLVLFGGIDEEYAALKDTWEWDGAIWERVSLDGPRGRGYLPMVYDSVRQETIFFGGLLHFRNDIAADDMWRWDGLAWSEIPAQALWPDLHHGDCMVFDEARGVAVLHGGDAQPRETWEWDGATWARRTASGPSGYFAQSMVFDRAVGRTVLFGQFSNWEWDGVSWSPLPPLAQPHYFATSGSDTVRGVVLLASGFKIIPDGPQREFDDLLELDDGQWRTLNEGHYRSRQSANGIFVETLGGFLLMGGAHSHPVSSAFVLPGDLLLWDGATWSELSAHPRPRAGHALAGDAGRERIVLFGGRDPNSDALGDTWEFAGGGWKRRAVPGPSPRYEHAMTYDSDRSRAVLFGGSAGDDETWTWDGQDWVQHTVPGPSGRTGHVMAFDAARSVVILFGGSTNGNETWGWDGTSWSLLATTGPDARSDAAMAYDERRGVCVLFGGDSGDARTWEWDGTQWRVAATSGPPTRQNHTLTYVAALDGVVMVGGSSQSQSTWRWNGIEWDRVAVERPIVERQHAAAVDPVSGTLLCYSGQDLRSGARQLMLRPVPGDLNLDSDVDLEDMLRLLSFFGAADASLSVGDVDADGSVTFKDLLILLQHFGDGC